MKVLLIQAEIKKGNPDKNREKILEMMEKALNQNPQVLVLPELWNTGYADNYLQVADKEGQSTLGFLSSFARKHNVNIVGGSTADYKQGKLLNRSLIINRQGELVGDYSKIHLFSLNGEQNYFSPGEKIGLFKLDNVSCGIMICYDLRFPELSRALALEGVEIIFVCAQWPRSRIHAWRTLACARAAENQVFLVGVNRAGIEGEQGFGGSLAVDPGGEILAEAGEEESVLAVEIFPDQIKSVRKEIYYLRDRRPEIY
ncbi:carbon-nitrogen family hydrolase [Candidatus Contubernalis alkaliaceticus]|uniref:carbon-nitrogen family hydrolase n=1 Tax=Candidatus Contubernalis alkaliaceticus TaxID=338645 RepID=UPI001F4BF039|nr:carbon-nitrogen family hydrolase [Candidatus Contubernalis alkalaceticus]UNC93370.1 carbon-nitrogen family hydrolase [Candidatus Contubernalis alkalaceticus]